MSQMVAVKEFSLASHRAEGQLALFYMLLIILGVLVLGYGLGALISSRSDVLDARIHDTRAGWRDFLFKNEYMLIVSVLLGGCGVFLVPVICHARMLVGRPLPVIVLIVSVPLGVLLLWLAERTKKQAKQRRSRNRPGR